MKWSLWAALCAGGLMMIVPARGEEGLISVELDPAVVICQKFMGFGVEWDSNNYNASKVNDADFMMIRMRVEWMRLPIARIMMQSKWCYKGNGRYDWDDPQMKSLYRHLDVCQELGTTVLLTDWGIESRWLETQDMAKVEDPKYAEVISTYMDHLLNTKGYTCIKYFILVNEPNLAIKDWQRWKTGVQNVAGAFQKKGLAGKIALMGSDHSVGDDWHRNAVDQLKNTLGGYDIHRYPSENEVRTGSLFNYYRENWTYALTNDPEAKGKPLIVSEAGLMTPGYSASNNPLHLSSHYGVLMSDYAVQAANAGSWAVLAWMLDDNSHLNFTWGMWKSHNEGLTLKPWFYPWSLLSRCFRPGTTIVQAKLTSPDVRVLAAYEDDQISPGKRSWAFCIVNQGDASRKIRLHLTKGPRINLSRYVFSSTSTKTKTDKNGFPARLEILPCDLDAGVDLTCEANSVLFLSSDNDDLHNKTDSGDGK